MEEKLKIFFCEDDENLGMLLREYLQAKGYVTDLFSDGEAGYKGFTKGKYDLCVLDVMMPKKDGFTLAQEIRSINPDIPVIFLTAKTMKEDILEGFKIGADDYLTKPFSARLLYSRVRNLLEMRKRLALQITGKTKELTHEAAQTGIHLNKLDEEFLRRFTEVVTEYINREKLDIPFMAAEMNMSVSTLYRKLKGLTGLSGNEFIRKIKLKHSLRLLTEQGLNVTEAAYASGFNDLGHFRRCFKEEYGVSPSKYAKQ